MSLTTKIVGFILKFKGEKPNLIAPSDDGRTLETYTQCSRCQNYTKEVMYIGERIHKPVCMFCWHEFEKYWGKDL